MFDNVNIVKGYKLQDNIIGSDVEIATFNANLNAKSNINVFMNINYPTLYETHKDNILEAYREFNAEVSVLACSMGLANAAKGSTLEELESVRQEFKEMAIQVFSEVIESLGSITVNPVPSVDYNPNKNFR